MEVGFECLRSKKFQKGKKFWSLRILQLWNKNQNVQEFKLPNVFFKGFFFKVELSPLQFIAMDRRNTWQRDGRRNNLRREKK